MEKEHVTEEDRQELLESFREVENLINDEIIELKQTMATYYHIFPFCSKLGYGEAVYSKRDDKVIRIQGSKIINKYSLFTDKPEYPEYECIEVLL